MSEERKGLVREESPARRRTGRLERSRVERDPEPDDRADDRVSRAAPRTDRVSKGRTSVFEEVGDLGRGGAMVGVESVAIALDILSNVLRNSVDRAFDEDYSSPGEVVRGVTGEADLAVYDLVDELRNVPRRLDKRFEESIRSPRADRGERSRRDSDSKLGRR